MMDTKTTAAILAFVAIAGPSALALATSCDFLEWTYEESELTLLEVEIDGAVSDSASRPQTLTLQATPAGSSGGIQLVDLTTDAPQSLTLTAVEGEETNNVQ